MVEDVGVFLFYAPVLRPRSLHTVYQPIYSEEWLGIPNGARTAEGELVVTSMIKAVDYREALAIYRSNVRLDNGR